MQPGSLCAARAMRAGACEPPASIKGVLRLHPWTERKFASLDIHDIYRRLK
jgi:hypothetical protein